MGWLSIHGASRRDIIRQQLDGFADYVTVLRHCTRGNTLWALIELNKPGQQVVRTIYCGLMQRFAEGWGYKDLDESVGPVQVSCPLGYIDSCTEPPNEWAREWRDHVREYHEQERLRRQAIKAKKFLNDHVLIVHG